VQRARIGYLAAGTSCEDVKISAFITSVLKILRMENAHGLMTGIIATKGFLFKYLFVLSWKETLF